ncbi:MAG: ABC transporter substrate-binding protein [Holophagaceae bacterium]
MRRCFLLLSLCLSAILWAGKPIRIATSAWTTLNPLLVSQDVDGEAVDLLFDRLVTIDAAGNYLPEMLESWTVLKGGREVLLKLRPGLTWHDGQPIDAEDLVFTWRSLKLPRVREVADTAGGVTSFNRVVAEGPLTARIHLDRPRGTLLSDLYNFIPVPRRHYEVPDNPRLAPINFQPVGSGPYRLAGKATTKFMLLERWPDYRGVHGGLWPSIEISDAEEVKRILPAFKEGRYHFSGVGALRYYLVRKAGAGDGIARAVSVPQASLGLIFLNCDPRRSLLGDKALRQALAELIPWKELARGSRFLPTRRATSFWPPEMWAHDWQSHPLPNPARAAALLEAAGWRMGADGLRHNASGKALVLRGYDETNAGARSRLRLLAANALQAGIRIQVENVPFTDLGLKAAEHEGDLWSMGWLMALDPDVDSPLFTKEGYQTKANVSSYLNPVVDKLFDQGRHTLDPEQRKQIYIRISEILAEDLPLLPVTYEQGRVLVHKDLAGVEFNLLGQSYGFWPGRRGWRLVE